MQGVLFTPNTLGKTNPILSARKSFYQGPNVRAVIDTAFGEKAGNLKFSYGPVPETGKIPLILGEPETGRVVGMLEKCELPN